MDIRVGGPAGVGPPPRQAPEARDLIEAKLLSVRAPRRRPPRWPNRNAERRAHRDERDPTSGRVLVLLIPDGQQLPKELERGKYRVFLRFVRR